MSGHPEELGINDWASGEINLIDYQSKYEYWKDLAIRLASEASNSVELQGDWIELRELIDEVFNGD